MVSLHRQKIRELISMFARKIKDLIATTLLLLMNVDEISILQI
jgi:hypothetical protein